MLKAAGVFFCTEFSALGITWKRQTTLVLEWAGLIAGCNARANLDFRANIIGAIRNDAGMQVAISHCHPFQIQRTDLTFRRMFFKFFSG